MSWVFLLGAIVAEVIGTLSLKTASTGRPRWYVPVLVGYTSSFVLLSQALGRGLPLGVAYGIWAAVGVALTALLSRPLFGEPITRTTSAGIVLIVLGVLAIELGAGH